MKQYKVFYRNPMDLLGFMTVPKEMDKLDLAGHKEITTVSASNLEDLFRQMNVVDGTELPVKLRCRSLSVGDITTDLGTNKSYYCAPIGWVEIKIK